MTPMSVSARALSIKLFPASSDTVLYFLAPLSQAGSMEALSKKYCASIVMISGMDWDNDLSPWQAPGLGQGAPFGGHASEFLSDLTNSVFPSIEKKLPSPVQRRFLTGISLSGLFALYAGTVSDWDGIGSISGSFWYDGWLAYLASHPLQKNVQSVYLSLGRKEKRTRQYKMRQIETATKETAELLQKEGVSSLLELLPGNHFAHYEDRLERMISYLLTGTPQSGDPSYHP